MLDMFIKYAVNQDPRNVFDNNNITDRDIKFIQNQEELFVHFYTRYNPKDVEVRASRGKVIRFFDIKVLRNVQEEYGVEDYLVFASTNGDPIAVKEGKIYIASHGSKDYSFKEIASDFKAFLWYIIG